jgi:hypothetical protein
MGKTTLEKGGKKLCTDAKFSLGIFFCVATGLFLS